MADPPRIERRKSRINGWGVFALQAIPKNKRIIHYGGERIPSKESTPREERYLAKGHIWCFKLNNRWVIDAAVGGNVARFINHACKPNCYSEIINGVIWIRAARTIRKGEELTYNYYTEGARRFRAAACRGARTSSDARLLSARLRVFGAIVQGALLRRAAGGLGLPLHCPTSTSPISRR